MVVAQVDIILVKSFHGNNKNLKVKFLLQVPLIILLHLLHMVLHHQLQLQIQLQLKQEDIQHHRHHRQEVDYPIKI